MSIVIKCLLTIAIAFIVVQYLLSVSVKKKQYNNLFWLHLNDSKRSFNLSIVLLSNTTTPDITNATNYIETCSTNSTSHLISENKKVPNMNNESKVSIPLCSEVYVNLTGRMKIVKSPVPTVLELEKRFSWLKPGGHWHPKICQVLTKVAIVIPFRCRKAHLLIFLQHIHSFLRKQQIYYTIFVVEQNGTGAFNRARLMNIGYKEALNFDNFDCFIFHDIDLLPEDYRNLYTCSEQPRHMSVAVDVLNYRLPFKHLFGGVTAISRKHFELLNGYSNSFWGWGGEDNDMSNRIRYHKLHISRYPISIARYTMLTHKKEKPNPHRYEAMRDGLKRFDKDGINNINYTVQATKKICCIRGC